MFKANTPFCDWCKREMEKIRTNSDGDEVWPYEHALAHVCDECFESTINREWHQDKPCKTMCETQPCKRGGDCWYTPPSMRSLPYETYFANRKPRAHSPAGTHRRATRKSELAQCRGLFDQHHGGPLDA